MVKLSVPDKSLPWRKELVSSCPRGHVVYISDVRNSGVHYIRINQPRNHGWSESDVRWLIEELEEWLQELVSNNLSTQTKEVT